MASTSTDAAAVRGALNVSSEPKARAVQDFYEDRFAHCYGCGRLNREGIHLRSFVEGDEVVARIAPSPDRISFPDFAYGGYLASILDCHSIATAASAAHAAHGRAVGTDPIRPFVTASLKVDFVAPTPADQPLELRARAVTISGRKVVVTAELFSGGQPRATAKVVAVEMPDSMAAHGRPQ